jgi:hypothetical protein
MIGLKTISFKLIKAPFSRFQCGSIQKPVGIPSLTLC